MLLTSNASGCTAISGGSVGDAEVKINMVVASIIVAAAIAIAITHDETSPIAFILSLLPMSPMTSDAI